jgi:DNA-binding IclR family transcriptional regulator
MPRWIRMTARGRLTISGPTLRLGPERLAALGPELAREADALSERLADNGLPAA